MTKVSLPCGRWSIAVHAEEKDLAMRLRHAGAEEGEGTASCACCSFSAGDGVQLTCPGAHRICRQCRGPQNSLETASRWLDMGQI